MGELPFEQELGFDSYQSSAAECSPNPLDDIFPSPRSAYTPDSPDTSSDIDAIVQDLLSSAPSSPSNSVFSLDNVETTFNAAAQEAPKQQASNKIPEIEESPVPVTLSLDSIAPGTIISDGGSNSIELVVENGVRKLVPVTLSSLPDIVKTEVYLTEASPPASPDSVSSVNPNKKLA